MIVPVILCGGNGTRLWPRSRIEKPKPFLPLVDAMTLFEATVSRCSKFSDDAGLSIVTGAAHVEHIEMLLPKDEHTSIIVEPAARNTAAAIALAANRLPSDAIMLVCPSDHHIGRPEVFVETVYRAAALAAEGWLVSFGIAPDTPETGFGYLKRGEAIGTAGYRTQEFVEKPDLDRAKAFLADGSYLWNGGIFAFRAGDFLQELEQYSPDMARDVRAAVNNGREDGQYFHPEPTTFSAVESISVDYAVMEKTARAALVPVDMGWSDIGNWHALYSALDHDDQGNAVRGPANAEMMDCRNVLIDSDGPSVSVIGLENVIIVVDGNDILVTAANGVQNVGRLSGARNQ